LWDVLGNATPRKLWNRGNLNPHLRCAKVKR
jgi:hypothetical protein